MSQMYSKINNQKKPKTDVPKNLIIVFGVFLSLIIFSSYNHWEKSTDDQAAQNTKVISMGDDELQQKDMNETVNLKSEQKITMHHNFIASYLLQESSFKKKNEQKSDRSNFFTNLMELHKIIISKTFGAF